MVTGPAQPGIRLAAGPGGGSPGPGIGRNAARELARHELSKPVYHQHVSLIQRILDALSRLLGRLHGGVNATVPGGWWTLIAVMALAVIIAGIAIARLGPIARPHRRRTILGGGQQLTAAQHRLEARRLAAAADWSGAIREVLRAIAGELEERSILPPRAGRTADELATEAAAALPGLAGPLRDGAALFDDVCYGERPGTPEGYAQLNDLDDAVRSARAAPPTPVAAGDTA